MATIQIEKVTDAEIGLNPAAIRKIKIEEFAKAVAATNSALWDVGIRKTAFQISQLKNQISRVKRDLCEQMSFHRQNKPNRFHQVRVEHEQLVIELGALEGKARGLQGPLLTQLKSASELVSAIRNYAAQCKKKDGGDIDSVLVDWKTQDDLLSLASMVDDIASIQNREYASLRADIEEKQ